MTKNKNLFKNISLFLCLVPMLILSIFCLIPNKNKMSVSALGDQVLNNFNFVSSKIFVPITSIYVPNGNIDRQNYTMINISFGRTDGIVSATIYGISPNTSGNGYYDIYGTLDGVNNAENIISNTNFLYVYVNPNDNLNYRFNVRVFHSGQLSSDIIKVVFSSYENTLQNSSRPAPYYNTITYYDTQGEFIQFEFPLFSTGGGLVQSLLFDDRTYYFTTSFDDNTFYNQGYDDGLNQGYDVGYEDGYQSGSHIGEQVGYQNGFTEGVQSANDYSFISLIGAVIDAPVNAFTSLLNFEILGFNILGFITGLLTLALVVFIIKLILGGK